MLAIREYNAALVASLGYFDSFLHGEICHLYDALDIGKEMPSLRAKLIVTYEFPQAPKSQLTLIMQSHLAYERMLIEAQDPSSGQNFQYFHRFQVRIASPLLTGLS